MNGIKPYVLVIDDAADTADSMTELLTAWGYDAEPRYGGLTALAAARDRRPAAVLLDIDMFPMDGFEFVARFRKLAGCERTPVVAMSGHTAEAYRARGRLHGIGHYLFKPVDPAVVWALLEDLIPDCHTQMLGGRHTPVIRYSAHPSRRNGPCFDSSPLSSSLP